ncbi:hypothetical protein N7456_000912 [Penicillium angulare]|uniref:MYND-type domain-containing protein n=1 Tax=Penicillium angulare TaxID=116970 RepID=A0A9W9GCX7_9EURO|nr:hypothetical protein N7456_000912 [Penicillium angulare]
MAENKDKRCDKCNKKPKVGLGTCSKCQIAEYCCHECLLADWPNHQKFCGSPGQKSTDPTEAPAPALSPSKSGQALDDICEHPFTRLTRNEWLHDRSTNDIYKLLVDTYRLRTADNWTSAGVHEKDGIYGGARDDNEGFGRFMSKVGKEAFLPSWWGPDNNADCVNFAASDPEWGLWRVIQPGDIERRYGDSTMALQLRIFGERVYGCPPHGMKSGEEILDSKASREEDKKESS